MAKIVHYRNKCIGCNVCFEMQPELWRLSTRDGKATLINSLQKKDTWQIEIRPDQHALSTMVADACPVKIIKVFD
jgi:ferredoxin